MPYLECTRCGTAYPLESLAWRCGCGGVLDVGGFAAELTAAPGAGATQFSMNVMHASHHGKSLVGQSVTITTDSKTKIVRLGKKTDLSSLQANDRVNVLLKVCNKDLPLNPATLAAIPAKRVTATVAGKGFKP